MEEKKKKERTIRSETTKVFFVIFGILAIVGIFSIFSSMRGSKTFTTIREVHLKQFKAAEVMKQKALDVIAIYYLLATDQDQNVLMAELLRYNPLVKSFEESAKSLEMSYDSESGPVRDRVLGLLKETKVVFDELNENCRQMLFPTYRGEKADTKKLPAINSGVTNFKGKLDEIEEIVSKQLEDESNKAQSLLDFSTIVGTSVTLLAALITLLLIKYLMNFLSISLLPISNLMHNMRQAVFSVDKGLNIISPVSGYSNVVFDEDIVGKNLQDVAFRDLEVKGETYTQHRVAMDLVFGEDEFQWSLVQDSLLRQVSVKPRGGDEKDEKVLKLSYAPLLEKGVIQNIMVVAEDVTEMEKLRIEGLKKQGKIEIIKGLMGIDTADLDSFLQTAYEQIKLSYSLLPKLDGDLQARQALFRTLHTLKGNSRMYKLNSVSEAVHTAENSVVEMNRRISEKEPVGDLPEMIRVGIQHVEVILSEHCKMASGFFGIKDYYSEYAEAQVRKAVYSMELLVANGSVGEKFSELAPTFDSAIAASNYFEAQDLADTLTQIKSSPGATKEEWEKNSAHLCESYIKMLIKKGNLRPYEIDTADWGVLFAKVVELTLAIETKADKAKLLEIANALSQVADKTNMLVATHRANSIIESLNSGKTSDHKSDILGLWGLFVTVSSLDMQKTIEKQGKAHANSITKDFIKALLSSNNLNSRTILSSVFTAMEDLLITMSQFWGIAGKILNVAPEEAANMFLGVSASRTEEGIIYHLKDGLISHWNTVGDMMKGTSFGPFSQNVSNHIDFKIDTMRLLGTFKAKNGVPLFGAVEQMMKVPSSLLNEIHELTDKMQRQSQDEIQGTVKELNKVIQRVHESPLATMFVNMTPMVQELAGRLGKNIDFIVSGDQVYVGRDRANVLRDALVHMIRNTIDHGVEMPDERASKGKSDKGQLVIAIDQVEDLITVSVADDGRGIDVERLTAKAVKSGFITQEKSDSMTHQDKLGLVFLPNLSTKEEVTAISGRGVGMDAVKNIVEGFGGSLAIDSELGKGVKISITFKHDAPGTMSANNNMNEAVLSDLLSNMTPMVAELAQGLNKDIDYMVKGAGVIVSRERSGALRDALIHIVRNTLDHGIESSEERAKKSKGSRGQLTIDLAKTENEISVSVTDDGRGIDTEKLVAKAVKLGMITQDQANAMNDQEKVDLAFLPNLSTKDEVTAISGRGVGMAAVKSIVEGFGGKVVLHSTADKGLKVVITFKPEPGVGMSARKISNPNDVSMEKICTNMSSVALEIAQGLSKKIDYVVSGDLSVPKDRSNALRDALVHLIRNSIDHGIEMPGERESKSKSAKGKVFITLEKTPQGMSISVVDDGKGIDIEKLTSKALKLGMITNEKLAEMTEQEKINLAFLANLSTKDQVTELSGRGVGMDAVKSIVEGLNGKVLLTSEQDKGVTVKMLFS